MAANSDEQRETTGADGNQATDIKESEATEIAHTDTQATPQTKPYKWPAGINERDPASERPDKTDIPPSHLDYSKEPELVHASQVDVIRTKNTPNEPQHEGDQPLQELKHTSGDTDTVQGPEQSSLDGSRENGFPPATGESGHPRMTSYRKEVISLFVRNVAKHVMEQQLVDLFSKYGQVDSAVVVRDPHSKECRGFGFVSMCTEEGARTAIEAVQDVDFEGRRISVERAKRREPHSRTPGAYMGIDRRIRERYAGMKRHRDYEMDRYQPYPPHYDMRGNSYRGRYYDSNRPRLEERTWDNRVPYNNQNFDERSKFRKRFDGDAPRYLPPRSFERDNRFRERGPPVPRESADDYI